LSGASPNADLEDYLHATAAIGDADRAATELSRDLAKRPSDTLLHRVYAPLTRATLLLRRGEAAEAARALAPASPYDLRDFDTPYERGEALMAGNDPAGAAAAFRIILANPGLGPDAEYSLAHLGLARALRRQGDLKGSRLEYEAFLAAWSRADPDLPVLRVAKAEYAALRVDDSSAGHARSILPVKQAQ
jgi:predicted Zn-dependent protease